MKRHVFFGVRCIVFLVMLGSITCLVNKILVPKYYFNDLWPTTSTYTGFYKMEENSIDVLFMGSSHAASCFNPQILYNEYEIKSYNLACEQQNMLTTYWWLQEALRFQKPKVVLLDTYIAFPINGGEPLNSAESCTRKAFDAMKWSKVKKNAVEEICYYDDKQTALSYYFPNIQYHTRWTELGEQDFRFHVMEKHYELKGFTPLERKGNYSEYEPFEKGSTEVENKEMVSLMEEYLDRIVEVCEQNDIKLILVKTPSVTADLSKYNTFVQYADTKKIEYWDFNEKNIYEECGIVFEKDLNDDMHVNIWGAEKISRYVASRLCKEYNIAGSYDEQWESTNQYYQEVLHDCELKHMIDIHEYLEAINQERYTILMAVRGDVAKYLSDDVREKFVALGLKMQCEEGGSYWAVIDKGNALEGAGMSKLTYRGSMRDNLLDYEIVSGGGAQGGYTNSIKVNNVEVSKQRGGINIVVYSNSTMKVIDSVCYRGEIIR